MHVSAMEIALASVRVIDGKRQPSGPLQHDLCAEGFAGMIDIIPSFVRPVHNGLSCHRRRRSAAGFTIPEMLAVVAVIMIIISMLLPTLMAARKHARATACMSNLHQWGLFALTDTASNRGRYFMDLGPNAQGTWMAHLQKFYPHADDFRLCPDSTVVSKKSPPRGGTDVAWGAHYYFRAKDFGSYGINHWVNDTPSNWYGGWANDATKQWRTKWGIDQHAMSPVFMDCGWYGANPYDLASGRADGAIPVVEDGFMKGPYGWGDAFARFTMNRHGGKGAAGGINVSFADGHGAFVQKNDLWKLNWYKGYRPASVSVPY